MTTIIGQGFIGVIRKIKIFEYPKLWDDIKWEFREGDRCVPFNGVACTHCDIENPSDDWDFRYKCFSICEEHQWNTDCRECYGGDAHCRTCFGSDEYHCHSCHEYTWWDDYDFHLLGTRCLEECGDGLNFGDYECDDGGNAAGDGCDALCKIEPGWICGGGSPTTQDVCYEVCGDNRRVVQACDDGNTNDGDGCSSACIVENGYACQGGGLTNRDICYEQCGDGFNFGNYECDDGNTNNLDGCSQACQVELGFTCYGGGFTTSSICDEICGDGMARGVD